MFIYICVYDMNMLFVILMVHLSVLFLLLIGDQKLTQSAAIISYLEDTVTGEGVCALFPSDALLRARVLQVMNVVQCDIHPLQNMGLLTTAIRHKGELPEVFCEINRQQLIGG